MGELDDVDALELLRVQSRQPAPRQQPGPINQDALRGYGAPSRPRPQAQPQPQQAPAPAQPDAGLQDYYLPEDQVQALPPAERDAYVAQRQRWLRERAGRDPEPQPQAGPLPQQAPAPAGPQHLDDIDALDMMRGTAPRPSSKPTPAAPPVDPNAEPDAPTWLGRRMQDIRGKQDPTASGLPNIASVIQQRGQSWGDLAGETTSWALGASDKDMGRTYQSMLGRDYVRTEQDANGYPIIVYRDNGQEKRAYVNNPGIDTQDVARGAYGALPFAKVGAMISAGTKTIPFLGRVFAQGGGQAATSVAQDATAVGTGVSDLDLTHSATKAGVAGLAGIGGEAAGAAIGALARKFVTEPRLYNRATGTLTPEGEAAARSAGVDPADLTQQVAQDFAKSFAKTGNAEGAFRQATSNEFGVRRSAGELAGNREQLLREQQMRGGTYGTQAREMVENFDTLQREDINRAVRGVTPPGSAAPSMAERIAPDRRTQLAQTMGKDDAGRNLGNNNAQASSVARSQEREAWEAVPQVKATAEALDELDSHIANTFTARGGIMVDDAVTPMAARMGKELDQFKAGETPSKAAGVFPTSPAADVQTMRKRLLAIRNSAQTPEDKRAAKAVYDAYLDWSVVAAEKAGDPAAAALARTARDLTRNRHEIFDGRLQALTKNADSPEGLINALFTGPTSEIKNGATTALAQIKRAYDTYLEPAAAKAAWDDVRLAYWLKMTTDRGNEVKNPAALASAIKNMMGTQGTVVKQLFSPEEIAAMRRLAMTMDDIKRKNPNTSWSAVGVGALMKDGFNAMLNMIGWNSVAGRTAAAMVGKPIAGAYGKTQATRATGGLQGARLPSIAPPSYGGLGGALGSQSQQ